MHRRALSALFALAIGGCAARPPALPANVALGARPIRGVAPAVAQPDAPARIISVWLSSDDVARGKTWAGEIVTTTNVASVEVRTNLFSIDVPRRTFGRFAFYLRVFDVPPIFIRAYRLRVIARTAAGTPVEEDLPFRIR